MDDERESGRIHTLRQGRLRRRMFLVQLHSVQTEAACGLKAAGKEALEGAEGSMVRMGLVRRTATGLLEEAARLFPSSTDNIALEFGRRYGTHGVYVVEGDDGKLAAVLEEGQAENIGQALRGAIVQSYLANTSERLGAFLKYAGLGKALNNSPGWQRAVNLAFVKRLRELNPTKTVSQLSQFIRQANIGNPLEEYAEERGNDIASALFEGEEYTLPSLEQTTQELVAFAIPGSAGTLANYHAQRQNSRLEARKKFQRVASEREIAEFTPVMREERSPASAPAPSSQPRLSAPRTEKPESVTPPVEPPRPTEDDGVVAPLPSEKVPAAPSAERPSLTDGVREQMTGERAPGERQTVRPMPPAESLRPLQDTYAKALQSLPPDGAPAILPKEGHAIAGPAESRRWLDEKLVAVKPSAPAVSFKLGGGFEGRLSLPPGDTGAGESHALANPGDSSRSTPVLQVVHESNPNHVLLEQPVSTGEQAYKALAGLRDTVRADRAAIETELGRGQQEAVDPISHGAAIPSSEGLSAKPVTTGSASTPDFSTIGNKVVAKLARKTAERPKGSLKEEPGHLAKAWSLRKRSKLPEADYTKLEIEHAKLDAERANFDRAELFEDVADIWVYGPGKVRRLIETETMKFDGSSNESFRTTVSKAIGRQLRKDRTFLKRFEWGEYLRAHRGPAPLVNGKAMHDSHPHHILYQKWFESQDPLVREAHELLWEAGIDPLFGLENLGWAPNRVLNQHTTANLQEMVGKLRELKQRGRGYKHFVEMLSDFSDMAAARRK